MRFVFVVLLCLCAGSASAARIIVNGHAEPIFVQPGETVTITVEDAPGTARDWISLYLTHGPDTTYYGDWRYLSTGTKTPGSGVTSKTFTYAMPNVPGEYDFRLFPNDSYIRAAISARVTVSDAFDVPPCTPRATLSAGQAAFAATLTDRWSTLTRDSAGVTLLSDERLNVGETALDRARTDLRRGACSSAAAVVGTVRSRRFLAKSDNTDIWGEYEFDVEQLVRGAGVSVGQRIIVTRRSGSVCTPPPTETLHVLNQRQAPLAVGARYLLFLSPVPGNRFASSDYDWLMSDTVAKRAQTGNRAEQPDISSAGLLADLAAVTSCE